MEFSGINLLSLIFCASLPELIRMVVRVCASNYLVIFRHKKPRNCGIHVHHPSSLPLAVHLSSLLSPGKTGMLLVNTSTEISWSHCQLVKRGLMKRRREATTCGMRKFCHKHALRDTGPPRLGPGLSPFPAIDPKSCDCCPSLVKAVVTYCPSSIPLL